MSVSLCSQFASSPAYSVRDGLSFGSSFQGLSSPLLAAPFARRDRYYGRARIDADRRLIIVCGAKWKKPANSSVIRKPSGDSQKSLGDSQRSLGVSQKPSGDSQKPSGDSQKSSGDSQKSLGVSQKSSGVSQKSSGVSQKPSGVSQKPSGVSQKPSGVSLKPSGDSQKPSGDSQKPSGDSQKSSGDSQKSSEISTGAADWEEFGASVSGEWDGYSAEFNMFGEPLELPSDVVPDAFHEWGQKVHDWQTQCPTLAHPEQGHLWYKIIKLLPTVGCEADAATVYSVENCDPQQTATALAYHKNGSYTAVWRGNRVTNEKQGTGPGKEVSREGDEIEVEQCLVHDKTRIRVLQKLGRRRHILIYREAWEGPFRNGESLGGCAAVTQAFATEKTLVANAHFGKWKSDVYSLKAPQTQQGYTSRHLVSSHTEILDKTFASTFFYLGLPKDTWTCLLKTESGDTTIETGWLVQPDVSLVTKCEVGSSGDLKEVSLRIEKRLSSKVAPVKASPEELEDLLTE